MVPEGIFRIFTEIFFEVIPGRFLGGFSGGNPLRMFG